MHSLVWLLPVAPLGYRALDVVAAIHPLGLEAIVECAKQTDVSGPRATPQSSGLFVVVLQESAGVTASALAIAVGASEIVARRDFTANRVGDA